VRASQRACATVVKHERESEALLARVCKITKDATRCDPYSAARVDSAHITLEISEQ
jgi:hypothetical protein